MLANEPVSMILYRTVLIGEDWDVPDRNMVDRQFGLGTIKLTLSNGTWQIEPYAEVVNE